MSIIVIIYNQLTKFLINKMIIFLINVNQFTKFIIKSDHSNLNHLILI